MNRSILLGTATVILVTAATLRANLVFNGDFELGNIGFSTGYGYIFGISFNPGHYSVDTNPANYHPGEASYGDHTSGSGNMLIVDGSMSPGVTVWEQSVPVNPGTVYVFSYYLSWWTDYTCTHPALVESFINGASIGVADGPQEAGEWVLVSQVWQADTTLATIRLMDNNYWDFGGNDFAIDDVSLAAASVDALVRIQPDTLNLKAKGRWLTCYIELGEDYDVTDIDVSTVRFNGQVPAELQPAEIGDYDEDGVADLMVKFDRAAVQEILEVGHVVEVTVTGAVVDGTSFQGKDTIRVIKPGPNGK